MTTTHAEHSEDRPHRHRTTGYIAAAAVNLVLFLIVHQHPTWIPWTQGVVTEDFPQVLWAFDLSLLTQVAGNIVLAAIHPKILRRLGELVFAVVGLIGLVAIAQVYPFNLGAVIPFDAIDSLAKVGLLIAEIVVSIAAVVHLFRFLFWWTGR